jgi:hypothetical protein
MASSKPTSSTNSIPKTLFEKLLLRNHRPLTTGEREFLQTVYCDTIDYDLVKIQKGLFLRLPTGAMVIDNSISFREKYYSADFTKNPKQNMLALLAHEACHVWQFQNLRYFWPKAALEHLWHHKRVYVYVPRENTILTDYRFEQQGKIVQDYVQGNHPQHELLGRIIRGAIDGGIRKTGDAMRER